MSTCARAARATSSSAISPLAYAVEMRCASRANGSALRAYCRPSYREKRGCPSCQCRCWCQQLRQSGLWPPQKKILSFSSLTLVALLPDILEHDSKPDMHGAQAARCHTASHMLEAT